MSDPSWWQYHEQITRKQDFWDFIGIDFAWELKYKPKPFYLTHEGYGTGTTCWYIRLEVDGGISHCCADTPQEAVAIGLNTALHELREWISLVDSGKLKPPTIPNSYQRHQRLLEELQAIDTEWADKPTQDTYDDRIKQKHDAIYGSAKA